ncbi:replicative DNA helicase [Phormidium sp. CCY1219]|uniref:replicative DNA helicase n=1 Tax=Phormidium sp. CCY1219 TaxID=2886104 RepID=UPI002D1ED74B|nr:replicative DNA helicase [Phormidium sp. CCY1219]MEB3828382.1 replicative DNA helicase [Phormidium sp. CCY1219]
MVDKRNLPADSDRLPPQNIDAEESILGGILLDPEAINRVVDRLVPEAFSIESHQNIYNAAIALHTQGKPTDLMTVTSWLADRKLLEKVGGQSKLAQLVERTVSAVNIDQYAELVVDKYMRRKLIHAGHEIAELGYETTQELPIILDRAEQKVFSLTQDRPQQGLVPISETLVDAFQTIETHQQGLALPGLPCNFYDLDAMTGGFQRADLIIVAGRPSMGKCLSSLSEILLSDGTVSTIENIFHKQQAELFTLADNWNFTLTQPCAFVDDGIKPVFRVTTGLGRFIETTLTHPYLTPKGWRKLSELKPGDKIAVPRKLAVFGTETRRECEVKLLAYCIGNGDFAYDNRGNINSNYFIISDFQETVKEFCQIKSESCNHPIRRVGNAQQNLCLKWRETNGISPITISPATTDNPSLIGDCGQEETQIDCLKSWLEDMGLWGKASAQITIPSIVFKLTRSQIALFLNRLFASSGWVSVLTHGETEIAWATLSEKLARQVQHLLLRFGIISALKTSAVNANDSCQIGWKLEITELNSLQTFMSQIGMWGKEAAIAKVAAVVASQNYGQQRKGIPGEIGDKIAVKGDANEAIAGFSENKKDNKYSVLGEQTGGIQSLVWGATRRILVTNYGSNYGSFCDNLLVKQQTIGEIYWDEITEICSMGEQQVYDLTIPKTHNFVANDICVHNTSFAMNIGRNIADFHQLPVAIFSLEMSKDQLVQRMLAGEAGIESNRLRAGRISQTEWEPLSQAIGHLSELPIFIDDTPNITVTEMRSKCRRLQAEQGGEMGLILLDYLQLMEGSNPDNRVQELSRITRSLKGLARELNVPIITLSQLSRGVEARTNKRPMMSDLRESGCLSGESAIALADRPVEVPIRELVGQAGFAVWGLNEATMRLEPAKVSHAFCTGVKPVFTLKTRRGQKIRATGNHQFLTVEGWKRLDEIGKRDRLALPDRLPNFATEFPGVRTGKGSGEIYWDEIVAIAPDGETEVFDLTVPGYHNFIANQMVVHNSIEQDADIVIMLYREEYYMPDTPDRGLAEIIVTKHRNGPTGTVKLLFDSQFTKFKNLARPQQHY